MKSRKRLNRYNAFKKNTKDLRRQFKESSIATDCISTKPIPIYNVRVFQDGAIKIVLKAPKRITNKCEVFGVDGNDNIIGTKESIERVFASSITNNIKIFN